MSATHPADTHTDVIIVGAGISGISAAAHLIAESPDRTFVMLEGRPRIGGTWDLFRYPGVRSDSDMYTLGFGFRPWTGAHAIADGDDILDYLRDTVDELGLEASIRFEHRVTNATFDSSAARWTVTGTAAGEGFTRTCQFLIVGAGYYNYRHGYRPSFVGEDEFTGMIIHPQDWPDDVDYRDKRVAVIGSGATAMTIVPAMAKNAAHVTMVQRSPTWVVARPRVDPFAVATQKVLPARWAHRLNRWKGAALGSLIYQRAQRNPDGTGRMLRRGVASAVGDEIARDHFNPDYAPWSQRLCLLPDGDLFDAINAGRATIETGTIDRFTASGVQMTSGRHVDADLIVTATGLELVTLGEIDVVVDGQPVDFANTLTYKGLAFSGVPNLVTIFGFVNASWTLRADMVAHYICRLLNHMGDTDHAIAVPMLPMADTDMRVRPFVENFTPGYMARSIDQLPKQGDREPWINPQSVRRTRKLLNQPIVDGAMRLLHPAPTPVGR